jgi:hypothetical protein
MTDSPNRQSLIQKHLDGQTSEEEANTLSREIETNAELRLEYLKAARIHAALTEEVFSLALEPTPAPKVRLSPINRLRPLAAAIVTGAFVGLLGVGVARAINAPKAEATMVSVANGNFEKSLGPIPQEFPQQFGKWSGDPSEVIEQANGNRVLRFIETANVTNKPNGRASACNVFQLIDLTSIQQQNPNNKSQLSLTLSTTFHRIAATNDANIPKAWASCTIHLYRAEPEFIKENWPMVINDALAVGRKGIRLKPGHGPKTISASCLLEPEANIALISINVKCRIPTTTPIELGGHFADNVQLTLTKQPKLPVRTIK